MAGHGAEAVRDAITSQIALLPEQLRRSLTWDPGAEMARHAQLRIDTGVAVYFCDPHSPLAARHEREHCECVGCPVRADRTGWVPAVRGDSREYWPPAGVPFVGPVP